MPQHFTFLGQPLPLGAEKKKHAGGRPRRTSEGRTYERIMVRLSEGELKQLEHLQSTWADKIRENPGRSRVKLETVLIVDEKRPDGTVVQRLRRQVHVKDQRTGALEPRYPPDSPHKNVMSPSDVLRICLEKCEADVSGRHPHLPWQGEVIEVAPREEAKPKPKPEKPPKLTPEEKAAREAERKRKNAEQRAEQDRAARERGAQRMAEKAEAQDVAEGPKAYDVARAVAVDRTDAVPVVDEVIAPKSKKQKAEKPAKPSPRSLDVLAEQEATAPKSTVIRRKKGEPSTESEVKATAEAVKRAPSRENICENIKKHEKDVCDAFATAVAAVERLHKNKIIKESDAKTNEQKAFWRGALAALGLYAREIDAARAYFQRIPQLQDLTLSKARTQNRAGRYEFFPSTACAELTALKDWLCT